MVPQGIDPSFVSLVQAEINGREAKIRLMNRQPVPEGGRDRKRPQLTHNAVSLAERAGLKKQSSKESDRLRHGTVGCRRAGQIIKIPAKTTEQFRTGALVLSSAGSVANADCDL
ncbi:hypothetical protein DdX_07563 [Ditylenchus destructor]|uniref:Uncharacterized protein n=1 Tax=Ditylenchus destructor TaxID=166010 RepID=A0AAD4N601_9BILA|nr:hypothetical protein DdX_07563 [Ditylenchus destructor]